MALAVEPTALVVPTKLGPPPICTDSLVRPRLALHLRASLTHPLTILCAPGGFGKTTLLASMLADSSWPVAWLSLDPGDSHLPTFLQALAAAIRQACPGACHTTLGLLQLPTLPSSAAIARAVQHDLAELSDDLVLVLDDYHLIVEPAVDALVAALLRHPPPRLHLVVASRELPPWPLARLRAADQTAELGADDLRFTLAETRAFLAGVAFGPVSEETAAVIHARTDGWAVGLRLAAMALRDCSSSPPAVATLEGRSWQHVVQYLLEEIVAQQPPDV
jgi:LuxR family maltose regulon positive regulatory protein